jgi:serine/threonine protein kinase
LCAQVIEMLSGCHPWPTVDNPLAAINMIANAPGGPPRPERISSDASSFLDACLRRDPRERPSAAELLKHPFVAPPQAA